MAKLEVLAFGQLKEVAATELKGIQTFEESHGRFSFLCTANRFEKIRTAVRNANINPFAIMSWATFTK